MPTHHQRTVNIDATERSLGASPAKVSTSDSIQMTQMYPSSPIHDGQLTPDERREYYQREVLDAVINDSGHTFGEFDTSYAGAPNLEDVNTKKHNLPSPYVPNPVSPGPGSQNDTDKGPPPDGFGQTPAEAYGTGVGSQLSPSNSSARTSGQTLGDYISGKSSSDSEA